MNGFERQQESLSTYAGRTEIDPSNNFDDDSLKQERKKAIWKVLNSAVIYFLSLNLLAALFDKYIQDKGILMIVIVSLSMLIITFFIGRDKLPMMKKEYKYKFGISDFFFFLGLTFILSFVFNIITQFLMNIFNISSIDVTQILQSSTSPSIAIYAIIVGPILEEVQYRGYYVNHLRKYGLYMSVIVSAFIFALSHMNFLQGIGTLGIGLVLSYIGYAYSFKAAAIIHIANNLFTMIIGQFLPDELVMESISIPFLLIILFMYGLMLYSLVNLFLSKRKARRRENLKMTELDKSSLKALFTDVYFIIYAIAVIAIAIILGSAEL